MPIKTYNYLTVLTNPSKIRKVTSKLDELISGISERGSDGDAIEKVLWKGKRTDQFSPDHRSRLVFQEGSQTAFVSPWGPIFETQSQMTRLLSKVDPSVVVLNHYEDELYEAVGVRLTLMEKGKLKELEAAVDMSSIAAGISDREEEENPQEQIDSEVRSILAVCLDSVVRGATMKYGFGTNRVALSDWGKNLELKDIRNRSCPRLMIEDYWLDEENDDDVDAAIFLGRPISVCS